MSRVTTVDKVIGHNLRLLRTHRRMEQQDLANHMASAHPTWSQSTVSEIECGRRAVLVSEARDLAAIFDVSLDFLLEEIKL